MKKISKMATASVLLFTLANPLGVLAENNVENISATSNNKLTQDITIQAKEVNGGIVFELTAVKDTYNTVIHATINGQKFTYNLGNLKKGQVSKVVQPDVSVNRKDANDVNTNKKDAAISKENKSEKSLPNTSVVRELIEKTVSYNTELNGNVIEAKVVYKVYDLVEKNSNTVEGKKSITGNKVKDGAIVKPEVLEIPEYKENLGGAIVSPEIQPELPKAEEPAAGTTPKAEEPAATTPKAEEPAAGTTPKAEEPAAGTTPKAEEPAATTPKAEEPAAGTTPKAEEPAAGTTPKAEEPAAGTTPKAEEPAAATTPKAEEPAAGTTPKAEEPAAGTTPKAEEPAAGTTPKAEEPAAATTPKAEEPAAGTTPKAEEPAAGKTPKAEEPAAGTTPKAEEPAATTPKAEEPAAGTTLKAEEPAAGTTPKAEEPAAGTTPKAEEPAAGTTPKAEAPAGTTPKVEEPAATTPKAEEPAAGTMPKAEEPAAGTTPKAEAPAATMPKAEEPAAGTTPKAEEPAAGTTPKAEEPAAGTTPKAEEPAAATTPKVEEPAAATTPKAEESAAGTTPKAEEPAAGTTPKVEEPAATTPKAEEPAAGTTPKAEEPAAATTPKAEEPAAGTTPKAEEPTSEEAKAKKELADAQKDGEDIINEQVSSKLGEIEKVKDEAEKEKLKAELKTLKEDALAAIKNAKNHDAAVAVTDEYQTKIDRINVPGEALPAPNYDKDNLTNGRNEGTTIEGGSTAIGHGSGEASSGATQPESSATASTGAVSQPKATSASTGAGTQPEAATESPAPTQPATEATSDSAPTAKPQPVATPETATSGTSSFRNAPEVQIRARRVARAANQPDGTVNISYNYDGMPDINGFLSDPGENNTVAIPNSATEDEVRELVKAKIQAKAQELAKHGYKVKEEIVFEQDTIVKNFNYVVTFTKEKTGTTGFRIAPEVQVRAKKVVKRDLSNKTKQINIYYNLTNLKDIAGALGEVGENNMLTLSGNATKEEIKKAIEEHTKSQIEKLNKQGFKVTSTTDLDQIVEGGDSYDYVVEFTKESKSTSVNNTGFRKAPLVQKRAKRSAEVQETVDVNIYFNLKTLPGIAGALDVDGDTTIKLPQNATEAQVKAAIQGKIAKVEKRGYKVSDFYFGAKTDRGYDFVVEFKK